MLCFNHQRSKVTVKDDDDSDSNGNGNNRNKIDKSKQFTLIIVKFDKNIAYSINKI